MRFVVQTLLGVVLLFVVLREGKGGLSSGGRHVCKKGYYERAYTTYIRTRLTYSDYYTKCGWWGWGRCKRSRANTIYTSVPRTKARYKVRYYCCSGWTKSSSYSSECLNPICSRGCRHGRCTAPNTCTCQRGYRGHRCEADIDECYRNNGGCQQLCTNKPGSYTCGCYRGYIKESSTSCKDNDECKYPNICKCLQRNSTCAAKCINFPGSYRCSCSTGYRTATSKGICMDEDECATSNPCEFPNICVNTIGSYKCICGRGFHMKPGSTQCEDVDECQINNGGCQHSCQNTPGSMKCLCRNGFSLDSDGRTCSDIDECSQHNPCEFNCTNTIGSFRCSCKPGFRLKDNGTTCLDIDECNEYAGIPLSHCEQNCSNTIGSFVCGCNSGFELRQDNKTCKDIDECARGTHQCEQICINAVGSYRCGCDPGYALKEDQKNCKALPCPTLEEPPHGTMICTGMVTNSNCSFACNDGYDLKGPSTITCMTSSRWSAPMPSCQAKMCRRLEPPLDGSVSLPCYRTYGSSCYMRCNYGYYGTGNATVTCDLTKNMTSVKWKNDFKCHTMETCKPNPCRHGGTCIPLTSKEFQCDCSNTGYEGRLCEHGVIDMPLFPKLKANRQSSALSFQAKPSTEIQISIHSDDDQVVILPSKLKLFKSRTKADFTLTSKQPGLKVISYSVQGPSAKDYTNPAEGLLFVGSGTYRKNIFTKVPILPGEPLLGCDVEQINLIKCHVKGLSSQTWRGRLDKASTTGIVHLVTTRGIYVPLSLLGATFPYDAKLIQNAKHFDRMYQERHDLVKHQNTCYNTTIEKLQFLQLVEHDFFAGSFLGAFSRNGPGWLKFKLKEKSTYFDLKNIHAVVGPESNACSTSLNSPSAVYFSPNIGCNLINENEEISLPDEKGSCYAIDVCTSRMSWVLSKGTRRAVKEWSILNNLKQAGWDVNLKEVMFPGDERKIPLKVLSAWDGEEHGQTEYDMLLRGEINAQLNSKDDVKISLEYNGDVYMSTYNISDILQVGFDRKTTNVFKGKIALNVTAMINKEVGIKMKFPMKDVMGNSVTGGDAKKQGFFFRWKKMHDPLQGTPLASLIQKYQEKPVELMIDFEAHGGKDEKMINIPEIKNNLTTISSLLPKLKTLLDNVVIKQQISKETSKRYQTIISEVESHIKNIQNIAKDFRFPGSEKQRKTLTRSMSGLRIKVENVRYFCQVLLSTKGDRISAMNSAPVIAQLKNIDNSLPRVHIMTKRSPVRQTFHGFKITTEGRICVGRLCFENMRITLKKNHEGFIIRGLTTKYLKLGKFLSLPKGREIILRIQEKGDASHKYWQVFFRPTVDIFGIRKVVSAEIIESSLSFNASGLILGRHQAMINVRALTNDVAEWNSLKFVVRGILNKNANLIRELQTKINSRLLELSEKARNRVKDAENTADTAKHRLDILKQVMKVRKEIIKELEIQKRRSLMDLRQARKKYLNYTSYYDKRLPTNTTSKNPKSSGIPICRLRQCQKIRVKKVICAPEQKRLKIPHKIIKCSDDTRTISVQELKRVTEVGSYIDKTYKRREYDSCKDVGRAAVSVGFFAVYGAAAGTAIGALGGPAGMIGGAIAGAVVGGIVGSLIGARFTGCDITVRSIAVYQTVYFTNTTYRRISVKKTVTVSNCGEPTTVMKLSNGFGMPVYVCNDSFIHMLDPDCVDQNAKCVEKLNSLRNVTNLEELSKLKQLKTKNNLACKMESAKMKIDSIESKLMKAKKELKMARSQLSHALYANQRAVSAVEEVKKFKNTELGLKISDLLHSQKPHEIALISEINFDFEYQKTQKLNMPMSMKVFSKANNKEEVVPFVADLDEIKTTSKRLSKKVIDAVFGKKGRGKRSIPEETSIARNDTNDNSTVARRTQDQDSCLVAKSGNQFFKDIVIYLHRSITAREILRNSGDGNQDLRSLYRKIENLQNAKRNRTNDTIDHETDDSLDEMLDIYLELIKSLLNDSDSSSLLSWDDILNNWKSFLEVLTKENALSYCAGALDCVKETGENLQELYFYEESLSRAREIRHLLPNITDGITYLMTQNITMNETKERISEILQLLNHTDDKIVLCGEKPELLPTLNEDHVVLEGNSFELECNVNSDTPLQYTWIHDEQAIRESVVDSVLKIANASKSHEGGYKCKAANHKGYVISNVTIITINSKPKITLQPSDTRVYTKDITSPFLLSCNASGDPAPHIQWFFIPLYPNSSTVKVNESVGPFLNKTHPTTNDSGHYFCVANNIHGRAETKKAQVLVLDMCPGEPNLVARINVTKTCKTNSGTPKCGKFEKSESKDEDDQDLRMIKQALGELMNTSMSQISKVVYQSNTQRNATVVFLYRSNKPVEEEEINQDTDNDVQEYARKRQQLFLGFKKLYRDVKDGLFNASSETEVMEVDPESLVVFNTPPGCALGQTAHSNGFMCANCPPGTHGIESGLCTPCPLQTYNYEQGQPKCTSCDEGFITNKTGALYPDECIDMRTSPPRDLQAIALSSTELQVHWKEPLEKSATVLYYFIEYGQSKYSLQTVRIPKTARTWTLTRLKMFTDYHIAVYSVNSYGRRMSEIIAKTGEDVPNAAPVITSSTPVNRSQIRFTWSPIPAHQRNGIIQGYKIYYKGLDTELAEWQSHIIEDGNINSGELTGLKSSAWYCIKMSAFTRKGQYASWKNTPCWTIKIP